MKGLQVRTSRAPALDGHQVMCDACVHLIGEATKVYLLLIRPYVRLPPLCAPAQAVNQVAHPVHSAGECLWVRCRSKLT